MKPFFEYGLGLLPHVSNWFDRAKACSGKRLKETLTQDACVPCLNSSEVCRGSFSLESQRHKGARVATVCSLCYLI